MVLNIQLIGRLLLKATIILRSSTGKREARRRKSQATPCEGQLATDHSAATSTLQPSKGSVPVAPYHRAVSNNGRNPNTTPTRNYTPVSNRACTQPRWREKIKQAQPIADVPSNCRSPMSKEQGQPSTNKKTPLTSYANSISLSKQGQPSNKHTTPLTTSTSSTPLSKQGQPSTKDKTPLITSANNIPLSKQRHPSTRDKTPLTTSTNNAHLSKEQGQSSTKN